LKLGDDADEIKFLHSLCSLEIIKILYDKCELLLRYKFYYRTVHGTNKFLKSCFIYKYYENIFFLYNIKNKRLGSIRYRQWLIVGMESVSYKTY